METVEQDQFNFHTYLHSKYPPVLQKHTETEPGELYKEIETIILSNPADLVDKLIWELPLKLEILRKNYGLTQDQREFIGSIYLHYTFDKPTSVFEKQDLLVTLNRVIGNKKLDNVRLSWKKVYHFLDEVLFSTKVDFNLGRAAIEPLFMNFLQFLKKARWLYEESHLEELFTMVRQTIRINDTEKVKAFALLYCFFKGHKNYSSKYYEKYLPEIMEFWSWKIHPACDKIFFEVLSRLAK